MTYNRVADREETEAERLDRQLEELLQEVRVAVPGVQVLFAFLLTVPFTAAWDKTTGLQQDVYFATLLLTAIATALPDGPDGHPPHPLRARREGFIVQHRQRSTASPASRPWPSPWPSPSSW